MTTTPGRPAASDLPIHEVLDRLIAAVRDHPAVVLGAPPGAGKTTGVPLALLDSDVGRAGTILVLEPRRLAARAAAERMAHMRGEPVGETVGYRTRLQSRVGPKTRIEVITEGIFTRRIIADPGLEGVAAVLFDEFHERSLDADLGLALARDVQAGLRPDLRLLLMSATLDEAGLARALNAATVRSQGRAFPVRTDYRPPRPEWTLEEGVARAVRTALREETGNLLVFLPGEVEIRRCARQLADVPAQVRPLYGRLERKAQQAALAPPPAGERKLVLATAVAETSLTIEGVRVVIDSGWARHPVFDPNAGFGRLTTRRVSQDAADQRRGRAGRLEPGVCYRLWSSEESLSPLRPPELHSADLSSVALNVAAWGGDPPWLEAPPPGAWAQAWALLAWLGLVDAQRRLMPAGRQVVDWGAHPRIGALLRAGCEHGAAAMACDLAALLELEQGRGDDLHARWLAWRRGRDGGAELARDSQRWRRRLGVGDAVTEADSGPLLAAAFPDRIAQRRADAASRYQLRNGRGAVLGTASPLAGRDFLVVAELSGGRDAQIRQAVEYDRRTLLTQFSGAIEERDEILFNPRQRAVECRRQRRLDALLLASEPLPSPDPQAVAVALLSGVRQEGVARLPWQEAAAALRARLAHARLADTQLPPVDDASLEDTLEAWLLPFLVGRRRLDEITPAVLAEALRARLSHAQRQRLEQLAPRELTLPGGRQARLDYLAEDGPVLAVRLQDLLGQARGPEIAGRPVLLHLLSPARRPLAVTRDLASFWQNAYPEVRKQMRGRYPKHPWPEDPLQPLPPRSR